MKDIMAAVVIFGIIILAVALLTIIIYWRDLRLIHEITKRQKSYQHPEQIISANRGASISTTIKSQNDQDYSGSFGFWG